MQPTDYGHEVYAQDGHHGIKMYSKLCGDDVKASKPLKKDDNNSRCSTGRDPMKCEARETWKVDLLHADPRVELIHDVLNTEA